MLEFTEKGKKLFSNGILIVEDKLGEWEITVNKRLSDYRLVIAKRALEVKALIDMDIIRFKD